jgi:hypothetical protein
MKYKDRQWSYDAKQGYSPPKSKESGKFISFGEYSQVGNHKGFAHSINLDNGYENHKKR